MIKNLNRNIKLGIFIIAGTTFFTALLYFVGAKRNLFTTTIKIKAAFYNAEGLMSGNSVRFSGINIGTVESVSIINDSTVLVEMIIQKTVTKNIKKNAIASIGTDGLMGNKIVNITSINENAGIIKEGDELTTYKSINTTDMLKTLAITNDNVKLITEDLKQISTKVNNKNSLWALLADTIITYKISMTVDDIKRTSSSITSVAARLENWSNDIEQGNGSLGTIFKDKEFSSNLRKTMHQLSLTSSILNDIATNVQLLSLDLKKGKGATGVLLSDSVVANNLKESMIHLESGTKGFSENM